MIFFFSCFVRTRHSVSNFLLKFNYISNNTENADNRSGYIGIPPTKEYAIMQKGGLLYIVLFNRM